MVRIGTVWDRTMEVISGRFAILAGIALLLLFAPPVLQAAVDAFGGKSGTMRLTGGVIGILVGLAAIAGTLALTAVATDPAVDQRQALAIGGRRLGPAVAIVLVVTLLLFLLAIPGGALMYASGFDIARARAGLDQTGLDAGTLGAALLYFVILFVFLLWLAARLVPLMAVIVNERRGLGAIGRSLALTRGATLKLIGVLILYGIVAGVALLAATAIVGLVVRLIVGGGQPGVVALAVAIASAAVTTGFSVLQSVFSGQYYVAAREMRDAA